VLHVRLEVDPITSIRSVTTQKITNWCMLQIGMVRNHLSLSWFSFSDLFQVDLPFWPFKYGTKAMQW